MILVLFNFYTTDKYIPTSENNCSYFTSIKYGCIPKALHFLLIAAQIGFFRFCNIKMHSIIISTMYISST
jgi:hypothetical protein